MSCQLLLLCCQYVWSFSKCEVRFPHIAIHRDVWVPLNF